MINATNPTKTKKVKRDLYAEVTNQIISLLEKGITPWRQTWSSYGLARNYVTNHIYRGINRLLLNNTQYSIPYFMTFRQVKQLNGKIKKGAKADQAYYFSIYYKDEHNKIISVEEAQQLKKEGKTIKTFRLLKYFNIYNIANIEGIEFNIPEVQLKENKQIEKFESIIKDMPNRPEIQFNNANEAYYNPILDYINMPDIKQFETSEEYYVTLFHELVHSSGYKSRLNRKGITQAHQFASIPYSEEEIIAEMGAAFLSAEVGINYDAVVENNAAYLQGWLNKLKADKRFIFKVSGQVQQATRYILGNDF